MQLLLEVRDAARTRTWLGHERGSGRGTDSMQHACNMFGMLDKVFIHASSLFGFTRIHAYVFMRFHAIGHAMRFRLKPLMSDTPPSRGVCEESDAREV